MFNNFASKEAKQPADHIHAEDNGDISGDIENQKQESCGAQDQVDRALELVEQQPQMYVFFFS